MGVKATSWVWENSKQKGTAKLMLLAIADHADPEGRAFPGLERLAGMVNVTHRQARRLVELLEESGELVVEHNQGRGRHNRYIIPGVAESNDGPRKEGTQTPFYETKGDAQTPFYDREKGTSRAQKGTSRVEKGTPIPPDPFNRKESSSLVQDDVEVVKRRKAIAAKMHDVGVGINSFTLDHYCDMANDYGVEAVIRGLTAATVNGKQHHQRYVDKCIISATQGRSSQAASAWDQLSQEPPDYMRDDQ